jgi:hypothetical protein
VLFTALVPACNLVLGYDDLAPSAAGGASAGGGVGSGASGGASGPSSGSGAAGGTPECVGEWGSPETVLEDPNVDQIGQVAITMGELVVFYQGRIDMTFDVRMSTRAAISEPFGVGVVVPELSAICASGDAPGFDVTHDGLDVYIVCGTVGSDCVTTPCPLVHASRERTSDPFVVEGDVAADLGTSPAVARDRLAVYTSPLSLNPGDPLLFAERMSVDDPFGAARAIPGVEAWPSAVIAPEVSHDGRELYSQSLMSPAALLRSERGSTEDSFPPPSILVPGSLAMGSPDLTADCHGLYYVALDTAWVMQVMRR